MYNISVLKDKLVVIVIIMITLFFASSLNSFAVIDQAGIFSANSLQIGYEIQLAQLAREGMQKLGYNITEYNDSVTEIETIVNYITDSGNHYAMYLNGHGAEDVFSIYQTGNEIITPTNNTIKGYWHFIFMSSCSSAATDTFANAFKTTGYTNRAFMGWYKTVEVGWNYRWSQQFWPHVGENTLRQVALDATSVSNTPGTTPIRMYGDKNWYGWAWDK